MDDTHPEAGSTERHNLVLDTTTRKFTSTDPSERSPSQVKYESEEEVESDNDFVVGWRHSFICVVTNTKQTHDKQEYSHASTSRH